MHEQTQPERRYPRIDLRLPVTVSSIDPDKDVAGTPCFRASTEICANVSAGGAGLLTHDPLIPGRRVLLGFELPDGDSFETVGRVAWSRTVVMPEGRVESGCGVEFIEPKGKPGQQLLEILRRRSV
jgi:hypothetical protein